jgi:hypothetical protein
MMSAEMAAFCQRLIYFVFVGYILSEPMSTLLSSE